MGWFNKFFNIWNDEQDAIIKRELGEIDTLVKAENSIKNSWQRIYSDRHNESCPKCNSKEIVNKISHVNGSGYVDGSFALGFGSVHGRSKVDTDEVNHCSGCGHQWKKHKFDYTLDSETEVSLLNELSTYVEGKYKYTERTYDKLKGHHAETIYAMLRKTKGRYTDCYSSTYERLTLKTLRKHFKSIHD